MTGSIIWKSAISAAVLAWAILNIIPAQDTPFDDYIESQVTAEKDAYASLHHRADIRTGPGEDQDPTFFVSLKNIVEDESIDIQKFFPEIDATDVKNLNKRNQLLLRELLKRSQGKVKPGLDLKGGVAFIFKVKEEDLAGEDFERQEQLEQAIEIIRKRVDGLGVAEPVIRLVGENKIEVQMPGIDTRNNPDARSKISAPAKLEFSYVHRSVRPPQPAPLGYREMVMRDENRRTGEITESRYFVKMVPELTGEIVDRAFPRSNQYGGYEIALNMTDDGKDKFAKFTRSIVGEDQRTGGRGLTAIILDGTLYSVLGVDEEIVGGRATISGRFDARESLELSNVLNNPLKIGLEIDSMSEIGPSLAEDARDASVRAFLIGALLVVIFMIVYYLAAGFVAVLSVSVNIVIVFGTLSSIDSTVTLPGVAALVLTIGMAVDANILIFERIREELRGGKPLGTALISGYDKALSTIVDANVTTLITAGILIGLGTGPVKGFGVTLAIGIVASMFCALIVSRWILELLVSTGLIKKLMQFGLFKETSIPFLVYRKPAFIGSWCVVLLGIWAVVAHQNKIFGIDFRGGEELTMSFSERVTSREVDALAETQGIGEVNTLHQKTLGDGTETLKIQTEHDRADAFYAAMREAFPEAALDLLGITTISASVGDEVKWSAVKSVALALVCILLYVAVRFEIGYGIGAVVATVHDIFMSIGVYVILGSVLGVGSGQFTAPMVAAVLMIIGYSLNDTIVVFDRIREELTLDPNATLGDVINVAINRTLSRTVLTSLTTLLATGSLYIFGAGVVVDFALVFIIGIFTGTFSSVFIASPVFFWWHKGDRRHVEERHDILPKYEWDSSARSRKPAG